jgi:hypothetical protein
MTFATFLVDAKSTGEKRSGKLKNACWIHPPVSGVSNVLLSQKLHVLVQ